MGEPKKLRKKYTPPYHPYQKTRIQDENKIAKEYGLKNKTELWKANSKIKRWRFIARQIQADKSKNHDTKLKELMSKLNKLGVVKEGATLDDVLSLSLTDILARRLQTLVFKKGLANSPKQSRQFVTHGKIGVNGKRACSPGQLVKVSEEAKIAYYGKPPEFQKKAAEAALEPVAGQPVITPKAPSTKPVVPTTKPSVPSPEVRK
jgi:small subunit ribosomal protein S4